MARQVLFRFGGETSTFDIAKHSREKLYGAKKKLVVDEDGEPCLRGWLSEDGATLLPPGAMASVYVNERFDVIEQRELSAVDGDGNPIDKLPSTLGVETDLSGPVGPERVLDFQTDVVYRLDPSELGDKLAAELQAGRIFEGRFNYRESYEDQTLFLLSNDHGVFALIGKPTGFAYIEPLAPPPAPEPDELDPFGDDFDFGMM